jgi:hypothetical protein
VMIQNAQPDMRANDNLLGKRMLHLMAAYFTHCASRHSYANEHGAWAEGAYAHALLEVCRGDLNATRLMDTAWSAAER